jgi:hypothetical protein
VTDADADESVIPKEAKLPRRDWFLLPLISLLTICLLAGSAALVARLKFSASMTGFSNCVVADPATGVRGIPNSVCWEKGNEGQLTEYRFNSCGHRAGFECGPKAPGTYRIVLVGSSFSMGDRVAIGNSFASLLPTELSQQTGRKVELYNEAMLWGTARSTSLRFNGTLEQAPDMILWGFGPWDIENAEVVMPYTPGNFDSNAAHRLSSMSLAARFHFLARNFERNVIPTSVSADVDRTRTMLEHFIYESQSQYVKSYRTTGEAEFLKTDPNPEWRVRLKEFDGVAAGMEERSRAAGVPFVAVLLPNRAQVAMISMGEWPAGYDPYKLGDDLRTIITSHGGTYIDILPGFRTIPNPEQYYLPVDGHPDADGHLIISQLLAEQLTGGAVPALRVASHPQVASGQDK